VRWLYQLQLLWNPSDAVAGNGVGLLQRGFEALVYPARGYALAGRRQRPGSFKLDRIDTDTVLSPDANRYLMVVLNTQSQG
jgi:hypothetical protein